MIKITDYNTLREYMQAFGEKKLNLLVVVSRGGLGKTFVSEEALLEHGPLIFTGHVTPLGMYKELLQRNQEEKDFIAIFDDVDALVMNKTNVALLKQLCDTREEKTIKYCTSTQRSLPSEFETKCKVLMLMNDIKTDDRNLNALLTRAHLIEFDPPDTEIIRYLKTFGQEKNILEFIELYAPFSKTLNLRVYKRATELKEAKLDWTADIVNILDVDSRLFEIATLLKKYKTDKEREKHFSESRPQYYRFKRLFLSKNPEYDKKK